MLRARGKRELLLYVPTEFYFHFILAKNYLSLPFHLQHTHGGVSAGEKYPAT